MSAIIKGLLWILMLPIKLIMLPFTLVGIMQKIMATLLVGVVVVIAIFIIVNLA